MKKEKVENKALVEQIPEIQVPKEVAVLWLRIRLLGKKN